MALTQIGKNAAVAGAIAKMKFVGLFKTLTTLAALTKAVTSGSKFESTGCKAAGFVNEKVVVFTKINGSTTWGEKVAGLWIGRPYFVVGEATDTFEVAEKIAGSAITPTAEVKTTTEVVLLEELAETPYVRMATAFGASANGESVDTEKVIKTNASTTITFAGWWEVAKKSTETKSNEGLQALERLEAAEPYVLAGEYKLTSDKLEGNPVA